MKITNYSVFIIVLTLFFASCKQGKVTGSVVDTTGLYHHTEGSGIPIIVIHGGPGLGSSYIAPHLSGLAKTHKVIYYDQRNSGQSPVDTDSTKVNLSRFVDDIDLIRMSYGEDKVAILAHSWGGLLGMKYALQYPDHISHLILMSSNAADQTLNDQANRRLANQMSADDIEARTKIMRTEAFNNQNPRAYEELMSIGFSYQFGDRNLVEKLALHLPEDFGEKSQVLGHLYKDMTNYNFTESLKEIRCPTLLLFGLKDPLTPFALNSLSQAIPNPIIKAIDDVGHFPFIEKPGETINTIQSFVK